MPTSLGLPSICTFRMGHVAILGADDLDSPDWSADCQRSNQHGDFVCAQAISFGRVPTLPINNKSLSYFRPAPSAASRRVAQQGPLFWPSMATSIKRQLHRARSTPCAHRNAPNNATQEPPWWSLSMRGLAYRNSAAFPSVMDIVCGSRADGVF